MGEISTIEKKKGGWNAIFIQYTQTQFSLYNFYTQFKEGNLNENEKSEKTKNRSWHSKTTIGSKLESRN